MEKIRDFGAQLAPRLAPPNYCAQNRHVSGPVGHRGSNGAPNCSSYHPNLPHIGFDGSNSKTNGIAVAAQNALPNMGASA